MAKEFLDYSGLSYVFTKIRSMIKTEIRMQFIQTAGTGAAYTATVDGIPALSAGASFVMIPHTVSTSTTATLKVNDFNAKTIRLRTSKGTGSTVAPSTAGWLAANKPIRMTYDGTYWIADMVKPDATDLNGTVPIESGGTGGTDAETARANLGAVSMTTAVVTLAANSWSSNKQTVSVTGVTADNTVIPSPAPASYAVYAENGVYCSAQAAGKLTFTCESVPSSAITVNLAVFE